MSATARLPDAPLGRPIRVLVICGPALEPGTARFAGMLRNHPDVHFLGGICESPGLTLGSRIADLVRRRGLLAPALLAAELAATGLRSVTSPRETARLRGDLRELRENLLVTPDLHGPEVLDRVREWEPDLALSYGGPILRRSFFEIPRFGTLGIHHGRFPDYRGKKTTFWALLNGETWAGVTIQQITEGLDSGPVVRSGEVPARGRSYRRVFRDVEELGLDLYFDAVLGVAAGAVVPRAAEGTFGPLYRDPRPNDLLCYLGRRCREIFAGLRPRPASTPESPGLLLMTESYHPMVGGGETQARAMAGELSRQGVPVAIATRRRSPRRPALGLVDGVPVHRVPPIGEGHLRKWGLVLTLPRLIRELRHTHPVVLAQGFRVLGIPALLTPGRRRRRVILKADSLGELSGAFFGPGLRRLGLSPRFLPFRTALALRNRILRGADAFVAISSAVEHELLEQGVPPGRIHRIPNGIDADRFCPAEPGERESARQELGLPADGAIVLYTGRLVSYKGLPLLIEVWSRLVERHPQAYLVLVGEGGADIHSCEDELRARVSGRGKGDPEERLRPIPRVVLTGAVERVERYLRAADVFVFPSEEESFGISVVEAMASGLPVVATRAGGLADIVSEESGALPVPVGDGVALEDALERLLRDPELSARLGRNGRRTARERYSIQAVGSAYLGLIRPRPTP